MHLPSREDAIITTWKIRAHTHFFFLSETEKIIFFGDVYKKLSYLSTVENNLTAQIEEVVCSNDAPLIQQHRKNEVTKRFKLYIKNGLSKRLSKYNKAVLVYAYYLHQNITREPLAHHILQIEEHGTVH